MSANKCDERNPLSDILFSLYFALKYSLTFLLNEIIRACIFLRGWETGGERQDNLCYFYEMKETCGMEKLALQRKRQARC